MRELIMEHNPILDDQYALKSHLPFSFPQILTSAYKEVITAVIMLLAQTSKVSSRVRVWTASVETVTRVLVCIDALCVTRNLHNLIILFFNFLHSISVSIL